MWTIVIKDPGVCQVSIHPPTRVEGVQCDTSWHADSRKPSIDKCIKMLTMHMLRQNHGPRRYIFTGSTHCHLGPGQPGQFHPKFLSPAFCNYGPPSKAHGQFQSSWNDKLWNIQAFLFTASLQEASRIFTIMREKTSKIFIVGAFIRGFTVLDKHTNRSFLANSSPCRHLV